MEKLLRQPALKLEDGRRPTIVSAPAAASPELSTVLVAARLRRKDKLRILGEADRAAGVPEGSARSCAVRGFIPRP